MIEEKQFWDNKLKPLGLDLSCVLRGNLAGVEELSPSCWGSLGNPGCAGLVRDSKVGTGCVKRRY